MLSLKIEHITNVVCKCSQTDYNKAMNNLEFIRNDAGLSQRKLASITWISYSLLSQIESGKRSLTMRNSEMLQKVLGVTDGFLRGESNFGIFCESAEEGKGYEILSLTEYKTQRAIGNITVTLEANPPYSEKELQELKNTLPNDWEEIARERTRPYIKRSLKAAQPIKGSLEAESMKGEISRLIANMNEEQLGKALLIIKEVILK